MGKQILFPEINGIMHGGDYNPEQWLDRPDILAEDIRMMKKAGMNSATLGVFSWSVYEPVEGEFHFEWLKEIMDNLYAKGIYTILATPSGAKPAWMAEKYPEIRRFDKTGNREHQRFRENHCLTSPIYREKVEIIIRKLYEAVGDHPGFLMWHISNEFTGECYCPLCANRFSAYLSNKFGGDINKLNHAWWNTFWSHSYSNFEQIEPPYENGEYSIMGLNLEWKRFNTWNMTDYMKFEKAILKELTPDKMVTTNFMQLYDAIDYQVMAKDVDVVSWDHYPRFHNDYESFYDTSIRASFDNAYMRGCKPEKPWMLMESAPGLVNWHDFNKVKKPGVHKLFSLQALANGSDTVQYFQWRKGRGSFEQYHGAVVDHLGTDDTRVFLEVAELGEILPKLGDICGTTVNAPAAVIYDWDSHRAIEGVKALADSTKKYAETCVEAFGALLSLGIETDLIPPTADLSKYKIVVAPMMYILKPGVAQAMKKFVADGGQLLMTYFSAYVDENLLCHLGGFPGEGLADLFGVIAEEIDTLYPTDKNAAVFAPGALGNGVRCIGDSCSFVPDSTVAEIRDYAEILRVKDADVLATYQSDFYADTPVVTRKQTGDGHAFYVAARMEKTALAKICKQMAENASVEMMELPEGVIRHERSCGDEKYEFYFNCGDGDVTVAGVDGFEMISAKEIAKEITLPKYGVAVIKK